jgi:hypothetical protein
LACFCLRELRNWRGRDRIGKRADSAFFTLSRCSYPTRRWPPWVQNLPLATVCAHVRFAICRHRVQRVGRSPLCLRAVACSLTSHRPDPTFENGPIFGGAHRRSELRAARLTCWRRPVVGFHKDSRTRTPKKRNSFWTTFDQTMPFTRRRSPYEATIAGRVCANTSAPATAFARSSWAFGG